MKYSYRKILALLLVAVLCCGLLAGCKGTVDVPLESIYSLNVTEKEINVGVTDSLMVLDSSDGDRSYDTTWASSNPAVVTVDNVGILTGVAAGNAVITATVAFADSEKKLDLACNVHVKDTNIALSGIAFQTTASTNNVNEAIYLDLIFNPLNATNQKVTFSSSDDAIVSVNSDTGVALTKAEGVAIITAISEDGGFMATRTVTVIVPKDNFDSLDLNKSSLSLTVGKSSTLTAKVSPDGGTPTIVWTSDNPSIATVSEGKVSAISAGTAVITATLLDNVTNKTASCKVTVKKASSESSDSGKTDSGKTDSGKTDSGKTDSGTTVTTVKATDVVLDKEQITVRKSTKEEIKFVAKVSPENTTETGVWTSSTPSVATIDAATGIITINPELVIGELGVANTKITYTVGSISKSAILIVMSDSFEGQEDNPVTPVVPGEDQPVVDEIPVESVTLSEETKSMYLATMGTLSVTVLPATATNKNVVWKSTDDSIVSVTNGVLMARKIGTVTITATSEDNPSKIAACVVTVTEESTQSQDPTVVNPTAVNLSKEVLTMKIGDTETLTASVSPAEASQTVYWTTSNSNVVTVNGGRILALAEGSAIITAISADGSVQKTCNVTISSEPAEKTKVKASIQFTYGGSIITSSTEVAKGSNVFAKIVFSPAVPEADMARMAFNMTSTSNAITINKNDDNEFIITTLDYDTVKILFSVYDNTGKYDIDDQDITYLSINDDNFSSTITSPAKSVSVDNYSIKMGTGQTFGVVATLEYPNDSFGNDIIIWKSTNPAVASIPRNGNASGNKVTNSITATGKGSCFIYAFLGSDQTKAATLTVTVTESVTVSGTLIEIAPGASYTLTPMTTNCMLTTAELPTNAIEAGITANRATGSDTKIVITVAPTAKSGTITYVSLTCFQNVNGNTVQSKETWNIKIVDVSSSTKLIETTQNIKMICGESIILTALNSVPSGVAVEWTEQENGGKLTRDPSVTNKCSITATKAGQYYVYANYANFKDTYIITIEEDPTAQTNARLSDNLTLAPDQGKEIEFQSDVPLTGNITWELPEGSGLSFSGSELIQTKTIPVSKEISQAVRVYFFSGEAGDSYYITATYRPTTGSSVTVKALIIKTSSAS